MRTAQEEVLLQEEMERRLREASTRIADNCSAVATAFAGVDLVWVVMDGAFLGRLVEVVGEDRGFWGEVVEIEYPKSARLRVRVLL